jgi:uncharacterized protein YlxW (UPF0749 family)
MHCNRKILAFLIPAGVLASALPLQAQTQRQAPTGAVVERLDAGAAQRLIKPLEVQVEELRNEVRRLQAALKSLALIVHANQSAYAKHRHGVASYGMTNVKSIVPNTPAIEGTMLVITTAAGPTIGQTGLPE